MELKMAVAENFPTKVRTILRRLRDVGTTELRMRTVEQSRRKTKREHFLPK